VTADEPLLPTFAASGAVLAAGLAGLLWATDGGSAFTTETLRRAAVAEEPVAVPDFSVFDTAGREQQLRRLLARDGRVWIVDFVYTRCTTLCVALGSVFQQLQSTIVEQGLQDRIGLLSISFDPQGDTPAAMSAYAQRLRMQPAVWQLLTLRDASDRRRLLDSFGIMVIPAPLGEFEHNAALHVVTPEGKLVSIVDLSLPEDALATAMSTMAPAFAPR
jgi:protein SCO1/2